MLPSDELKYFKHSDKVKEDYFYNLLTKENPYDKEKELYSIDGFGSVEEYTQHYRDEAYNLVLEDSIPKDFFNQYIQTTKTKEVEQ